MGIDFSHCDAQWAYSGFMRFRERLAKEIGMNLREMDGFCENGKPFSDFKDDIIPLLDHSDCDGHLTPKECKKIAPRLRELVADWDDHDLDKSRALELASGMEAAAKAKENLKFI